MGEIKSYNDSFNTDFCMKLEKAIGRWLAGSDDPVLKYYWCDGVLQAPFYNDQVNIDYLKFENVKKTKLIETTAWLGRDGQTVYHTTIYLGQQTLEKYAVGADLTDCVPDGSSKDWINIDTENKTLTLHLK